MAFKTFASINFFLTVIVLSSFSQYLISARSLKYSHRESPFSFVKHLQGHHLGENINGLSQIKTYLKKYGYLRNNGSHLYDDVFDDSLEAAIKNYQINFHLKPTGVLDPQTISKMIKSRCGVPDFVDGKTRMQSNKKANNLHTTTHYSFFDGNPKWPEFKYDLTYAFRSNTALKYRLPIISALQKWASASQFKFNEVQDFESADIRIEFYARDQGVGGSFDGPNGELAHAFAPMNGALHFDAEEIWTVGGVNKKGYDIQTVALHELGHILGLQHSSVKEAIMYPSIEQGEIKFLQDDDIQGLKVLYKQQ